MDLRNLTLVGFLTMFIIAVPTVTTKVHQHGLTSLQTIGWMAVFFGFVACFAIATRPGCRPGVQLPLIAAQSVLALVCVALAPNGLTPVLLVIAAGELGTAPLGVSLTWVFTQSAVLFFLNRGFGNAVAITMAYVAFQLFSLFALRIARTEAQMRCALAEVNTELKIATGLLEINSRAEERLRVSRDLHDLIGHHLTALTLNLEVASHLSDGQAREHIEKSKSLAKLLLSDVRDVVSRLRENEPVDVTAAVESLRHVIGRPVLHIDVEHIAATSVPTAEAALRAIQEIVTNAVRHSKASNLRLKLTTSDQSLTIEAHDDGVGTDDVQFGNGLRGMHERIEELHGTMEVRSGRGHGFDVLVRLPLGGAPT